MSNYLVEIPTAYNVYQSPNLDLFRQSRCCSVLREIGHLYKKMYQLVRIFNSYSFHPPTIFCSCEFFQVDKSVENEKESVDEKKEKTLDSPQESTTDSSEPPKSKEEEQDELKVRHISSHTD